MAHKHNNSIKLLIHTCMLYKQFLYSFMIYNFLGKSIHKFGKINILCLNCLLYVKIVERENRKHKKLVKL